MRNPNRLVFRLFILALLILLLRPSYSMPNRFTDWFCNLVGMAGKTYTRLTLVRKTIPPKELTPGARLVWLDVRTGADIRAWKADGCWSPIASTNGVYVLKKDGIWLAPTTSAPAKRVLESTGLWMLIGTVANQPSNLLVVQRTSNAACPYVLKIANTINRTLDDPPDAPVKCFSAEDLQALHKPDTVHHGVLVRSTDKRDRRVRRAIQIAELKDGSETLEFTKLPFDFRVDWFDPIWISPDQIVCAGNP
jgi:hypothetical protein